MRNFVDLHAHSNASDGTADPADLIALADAKKLAAIALTDHDTVAGLAQAGRAAEKFPHLRFVPGVEVSAAFPRGTLHVIGLGIDPESQALSETLRVLVDSRNDRNPRIIAALRRLGIDISMDDVLACAGGHEGDTGIVGRLHIAEALRRKGCVRGAAEAFEKYIGEGRPAFVDKERLSPRQAISAIRSSGGLAVLAHPTQLGCKNRAQLERVVRELIGAGLDGIEVYHTDHTPQQTREYLALAEKYRLLVSGGSDFHGAAKPDARLGRPRVPLAAIDPRFRQTLGL